MPGCLPFIFTAMLILRKTSAPLAQVWALMMMFSMASTNSSSPTARCQGLDNAGSGICDLRVNEAMYAYVHNAATTVQDGVEANLAAHEFSLEGALETACFNVFRDGFELNYKVGVFSILFS